MLISCDLVPKGHRTEVVLSICCGVRTLFPLTVRGDSGGFFFSSPVWLRKRPGVCAELIRVRGNGVAHVSEEERTWPHSLFCFVHPVTPTLFGGTSGGGGVQVGTAVWQGQRASKQASGRPSACRGRRRGESLTLAGTMRHPWKARLSAPAAPAVSPLPTSPPGPKWTDPWRCSRSLTRLSGVRG